MTTPARRTPDKNGERPGRDNGPDAEPIRHPPPATRPAGGGFFCAAENRHGWRPM